LRDFKAVIVAVSVLNFGAIVMIGVVFELLVIV
jgi:hypothetical protein